MEQKEFKSFFKTVGGNEGNKCHYPTRLDTYGCGCSHDCNYCLDGETLITMSDFSTKLLKDIEIGDKIIGVEIAENSGYKEFTIATVENKWTVEKKSYKITLENGIELICSENHRWLSTRGWKYTIGEMTGKNRRPYLTTNNLLLGLPNEDYRTIISEDFKKGYLSGIIRGDGHLKEYHYNNKDRLNNQYHFRLALKDIERNKSYETIFTRLWNIC